MPRHVFIPTSGPLQVVSNHEDLSAAVQGAVYAINLACGISLTCSSSNTFSEVNERATKLAGFTVQGDAALQVTSDEDVAVLDYFQSRKLRLQAEDVPELPRPPQIAEMATPVDVPHGAAHADTPKSQASHVALWSELPPELFLQVMHASLAAVDAWESPDLLGGMGSSARPPHAGNSSIVLAAASVCRNWRSIVMGSCSLLKDMRIGINPAKPFSARTIPVHMLRRIECPPIPRTVLQASKLGNKTAAYAVATILDLQGKSSDAMKHWRKAAKAGIRKAQLRMGEAFYKGSCNLAQDPEEAMLWLNRTVRGLEDVAAEHFPVAAQAFLLLGFMYFDGEGVPRSEEDAVRYFKRAALFGSREAEQTLGSIYNTGQYGSLNRWR